MNHTKKFNEFVQEDKVNLELEAEKKPGPDAYMTGLDKEEEEDKEDQIDKQSKMDDDDPKAYKEMPGDEEARKKGKVKKSKHTKSYAELYGESVTESKYDDMLKDGYGHVHFIIDDLATAEELADKIEAKDLADCDYYEYEGKVYLRAALSVGYGGKEVTNIKKIERIVKQKAASGSPEIWADDLDEGVWSASALRRMNAKPMPGRYFISDENGNILERGLKTSRSWVTYLQRHGKGSYGYLNGQKPTVVNIHDGKKNNEVVEQYYWVDKYGKGNFSIDIDNPTAGQHGKIDHELVNYKEIERQLGVANESVNEGIGMGAIEPFLPVIIGYIESGGAGRLVHRIKKNLKAIPKVINNFRNMKDITRILNKLEKHPKIDGYLNNLDPEGVEVMFQELSMADMKIMYSHLGLDWNPKEYLEIKRKADKGEWANEAAEVSEKKYIYIPKYDNAGYQYADDLIAMLRSKFYKKWSDDEFDEFRRAMIRHFDLPIPDFLQESEETLDEDLKNDLKKYVKKHQKEIDKLADEEDWDQIYAMIYTDFDIEPESEEAKEIKTLLNLVY